MIKKVILMISICIFFLCGCENNSIPDDADIEAVETKDYLSVLQENYDDTGAHGDDELFPESSKLKCRLYITNHQNNIIENNVLKYSGERMSYKLITNVSQDKEDGPRKINLVFFILIDGYMQPFYFENSEESCIYAGISEESSRDLHDYEFSFDPIYVPKDENAVISFVLGAAPEYFWDNSNTMINTSTAIESYFLTAASSDNKVVYDKQLHIVENRVDFEEKTNETYGFSITKKIENSDQMKINTVLKADEQLYATICSKFNNSTNRLFAVADGKLVKVFEGEYYGDVTVKPGAANEIALDMVVLSDGEKHQVYIINIDMDEIETLRQSDTDSRPYLYNETNLIYCVS